VLAADELDANDMVCDFRTIKAALAALMESWDHAFCINTNDPQFAFYRETYGDRIIPFDQMDPTSEAMARAVFDELERRLTGAIANRYPQASPAPKVRIERVRVTETSTSWAEYCP
jgi:6-pyruvoyltetrahydropterin/6-carboxytetrahydropterin synthase